MCCGRRSLLAKAGACSDEKNDFSLCCSFPTLRCEPKEQDEDSFTATARQVHGGQHRSHFQERKPAVYENDWPQLRSDDSVQVVKYSQLSLPSTGPTTSLELKGSNKFLTTMKGIVNDSQNDLMETGKWNENSASVRTTNNVLSYSVDYNEQKLQTMETQIQSTMTDFATSNLHVDGLPPDHLLVHQLAIRDRLPSKSFVLDPLKYQLQPLRETERRNVPLMGSRVSGGNSFHRVGANVNGTFCNTNSSLHTVSSQINDDIICAGRSSSQRILSVQNTGGKNLDLTNTTLTETGVTEFRARSLSDKSWSPYYKTNSSSIKLRNASLNQNMSLETVGNCINTSIGRKEDIELGLASWMKSHDSPVYALPFDALDPVSNLQCNTMSGDSTIYAVNSEATEMKLIDASSTQISKKNYSAVMNIMNEGCQEALSAVSLEASQSDPVDCEKRTDQFTFTWNNEVKLSRSTCKDKSEVSQQPVHHLVKCPQHKINSGDDKLTSDPHNSSLKSRTLSASHTGEIFHVSSNDKIQKCLCSSGQSQWKKSVGKSVCIRHIAKHLLTENPLTSNQSAPSVISNVKVSSKVQETGNFSASSSSKKELNGLLNLNSDMIPPATDQNCCMVPLSTVGKPDDLPYSYDKTSKTFLLNHDSQLAAWTESSLSWDKNRLNQLYNDTTEVDNYEASISGLFASKESRNFENTHPSDIVHLASQSHQPSLEHYGSVCAKVSSQKYDVSSKCLKVFDNAIPVISDNVYLLQNESSNLEIHPLSGEFFDQNNNQKCSCEESEESESEFFGTQIGSTLTSNWRYKWESDSPSSTLQQCKIRSTPLFQCNNSVIPVIPIIDEEKAIQDSSVDLLMPSQELNPDIIPPMIPTPSLISLKNRDHNFPGAKICYFIVSLASESGFFGDMVKNFVQCTVTGIEMNPQTVMRNVRQFVDGLKNYLMQQQEIKLNEFILKECSKIKSGEFLNLDVITERALHKCVVRPLQAHIYKLFMYDFTRNGNLQLMSDGIKFMKITRIFDHGLPAKMMSHHSQAIELAQRFLKQMTDTYSPLKKLENLMAAISTIACNGTNNGNYTRWSTGSHAPLTMDELLALLMCVILSCSIIEAEMEVEYIWGLIHPSFLTGEGTYYLTMFSSAVSIIKSFNKGSSPATDNIFKMIKTKGLLKICVPDEKSDSIWTQTLPFRPKMIATDICHMMAYKLGMTNPYEYGLYLVRNGEEKRLNGTYKLNSVNGSCSSSSNDHLVYKRTTAKFIWPKNR